MSAGWERTSAEKKFVMSDADRSAEILRDPVLFLSEQRKAYFTRVGAMEFADAQKAVPPLYEAVASLEDLTSSLQDQEQLVSDSLLETYIREEKDDRIGGRALFTLLKNAGYSLAEVAEWPAFAVREYGYTNPSLAKEKLRVLKAVYGTE